METDAYVPGMSIYVPISGTDEAVAVKVDDLPDVADLLGLLQAELAPLGLWLDLAKAYLQRGMEEQFIEIMRTGCSEGACATLRTRAIPAPRAWIARRNPGQIALALVPIAPLIDRARLLTAPLLSRPHSPSSFLSPRRGRELLPGLAVRTHVHPLRVCVVLREPRRRGARRDRSR